MSVVERPATPADFFRVAEKNDLLRNLVRMWRVGEISWDEMLLRSVVILDEQNEGLYAAIEEEARARR